MYWCKSGTTGGFYLGGGGICLGPDLTLSWLGTFPFLVSSFIRGLCIFWIRCDFIVNFFLLVHSWLERLPVMLPVHSRTRGYIYPVSSLRMDWHCLVSFDTWLKTNQKWRWGETIRVHKKSMVERKKDQSVVFSKGSIWFCPSK